MQTSVLTGKQKIRKLIVYVVGLAVGGLIAYGLNKLVAGNLTNQTPTMYSQLNQQNFMQFLAVPMIMILFLLIPLGYFLGKRLKL